MIQRCHDRPREMIERRPDGTRPPSSAVIARESLADPMTLARLFMISRRTHLFSKLACLKADICSASASVGRYKYNSQKPGSSPRINTGVSRLRRALLRKLVVPRPQEFESAALVARFDAILRGQVVPMASDILLARVTRSVGSSRRKACSIV